MYSTVEKTATIIAVWADAASTGCTSTTAALVAAKLAGREKRVLALSTDKKPYNGVSVLSDALTENTMDDLLILASSGGLNTPADFTPYATSVSDFLDVLKGSGEFEKISTNATVGVQKIINMAASLYDFIVIDVQGARSQMADALIRAADIVLCCISQDMNHVDKLLSDSVFTQYLADKSAMCIVTNYQIFDFFDLKFIEKTLGVDGLLTLSCDDEVHKAVCTKSVAAFVFGSGGGVLKGLFRRKSSSESVALEELNEIADTLIGFTEKPKEMEG